MNKINSFSASSLVLFITGCSFFGIALSYVFYVGNTTSLLSMITGFIFSFLYIIIILKFYSILDNKSITEKFKILFKKLSIIFNLIYILISVLLLTLLTYRLSSFLSSQYLIQTPVIIIHTLILSVTYYIGNKNIETISRLSIIAFYICITVFLFNFASLSKYINMDNYLPLFNISAFDFIKSSLVFSAYFSLPSVYINVINKDKIIDKKKFNKKFILMYSLSFLIVFLIAFTTIGVLGINLTNIFNYPTYTVIKKIQLFSFLDTFENFSIIVWLLYIIISSSLLLLIIKNSIAETFKVRSRKTSLIILSILFTIILISSQLIFEKNNVIESFKYVFIPLSATISLLFIQILSLFFYKKM